MNKDTISRAKLMSHIESEYRKWGDDYDAEQILGDIEDMPAADVQEVRNGHWEDINPENYLDPRMKCSVCGEEEVPYAKWKFCPNCGSRMVDEG